ncbi:MAG: hypothetical protein Ct9H300mP29_4590 [Candidatus Neomarinimicrobiota bacterium]|nr:MAG: hypothetical protein Ct9H300mP29_4590 [Candidatus Neomarinimicrobiota bacterium]
MGFFLVQIIADVFLWTLGGIALGTLIYLSGRANGKKEGFNYEAGWPRIFIYWNRRLEMAFIKTVDPQDAEGILKKGIRKRNPPLGAGIQYSQNNESQSGGPERIHALVSGNHVR